MPVEAVFPTKDGVIQRFTSDSKNNETLHGHLNLKIFLKNYIRHISFDDKLCVALLPFSHIQL